MSRPTPQARFDALTEKTEACWNWTGYVRANGYGQFFFRGRPWKAHRVAWILANGDIPARRVIAHTCDNRRCVRPSHLVCWTQRKNMRDMWAKGRNSPTQHWPARRGEASSMTSLTDEDVRYIRTNYRRYQHPGLHHRFGVSKVVIHNIVTNKTWRHILPQREQHQCEVK